MGKIGDLWVRLGLKSDEFSRGIDNSKKKTEELKKPIGGVKESFEKLKAGAVAVWAAIGASVVAFGKEMIKTTNAIGDQWAMFTAQAKAGWTTFVQAVSNFDFDGFIDKFKEATAAAKELQATLDYEFEATNSIKIRKSAIADELEVLRIAARDQTKSLQERLTASQEYIRKITPIYEDEIKLANDLLDAWQGKWLAGTKLKDTAQTRQDLMRFLVDYGRDRNLSAMLGDYLAKKDEWDKFKHILSAPNANEKAVEIATRKRSDYMAAVNAIKAYGNSLGYETFLGDLADVYENWRGDEDTIPLVEAIINAGKAQAGLNQETRQIQTLQNSILAQLQKVESSPVQSVLQQARADIEAATAEDMAILDRANELRVQMAANELPKMTEDFKAKVDALAAPDLFSDKWKDEQIANLNELQQKMAELGLVARAEAKTSQEAVTATAQNSAEFIVDLSGAISASLANGIQALTDMAFGLEGATIENALHAFLLPFAETMKEAGAMIAGFGASMAAFKVSFTNPAAAIAAGTALMALGSVVSSGLKAIIANPVGGSGSAMSYGSSAGLSPALNYESTLTVEVVGRISGSDILLSGQKTQKKMNR